MATFVDYQAVVRSLQECKVEAFVWERPDDVTLRGCERACFRLRVPQVTYDAFFNSPVGYRAQFATSARAGYEANFQLLDALEPILIRHVQLLGQIHDRVVWSLRGPDAKIWINESEVQAQMGHGDAQILYEPWQSQSEDGAGLLAPLGELLEVKGAWVDSASRFQPNPKKAARADEIHRVGFS